MVWEPAVRPALTRYDGHDGVIQMMADVRAAYGQYRVEVEDIIPVSSAQVSARVRVIGGQRQDTVDTMMTIQDGLVIAVDSRLA